MFVRNFRDIESGFLFTYCLMMALGLQVEIWLCCLYGSEDRIMLYTLSMIDDESWQIHGTYLC